MRRNCPECGSTSVVMFNADEDWCTGCNAKFPGESTSELTTLRADLAAAQSTIALIQKIAGCQVDRLVEVVEGLVKERGELQERIKELERDEEATRKYWSNAYYAMEAERDELKAEAVRFKIHLEQKDRALAANAEEYRKLEVERDRLNSETNRLREMIRFPDCGAAGCGRQDMNCHDCKELRGATK